MDITQVKGFSKHLIKTIQDRRIYTTEIVFDNGVKIGNKVEKVNQRVRQGSSLTSPLFNIYIDRPTGRKHTTVGWEDCGNIGKIIN